MSKRNMLNLVQTTLLNIALPLITFVVLTGLGVHPVLAYLLSGAWPVVEVGISIATTRRVDELSIIILVFLALSIVAALALNSPKLLLVKGAAGTGLSGLVFLGSLLLPKPLAFYFGRRYATDGTVAGAAWWDGLWQYPSFRRSQRAITIVWAVAFLGDAIVRLLLIATLPFSTSVVVAPFVLVVAIAAGVTITIGIGKRTRRGAGAGGGPAVHGG